MQHTRRYMLAALAAGAGWLAMPAAQAAPFPDGGERPPEAASLVRPGNPVDGERRVGKTPKSLSPTIGLFVARAGQSRGGSASGSSRAAKSPARSAKPAQPARAAKPARAVRSRAASLVSRGNSGGGRGPGSAMTVRIPGVGRPGRNRGGDDDGGDDD